MPSQPNKSKLCTRMNNLKLNKLTKNPFVKETTCKGLALLATLVLFYFMSALISNTADLSKKNTQDGLIEFIRIKPKSFLDEKKRKLPQKKPKEPTPPKMKTLPSALTKPQKINPKMNLPDIKSIFKSGDLAVAGTGGTGLGSGVTPLVRIEPQYPRKAAMQSIEGYVRLMFDITPAGTVTNVRVLDSKPPRIFNRSAVRAVLKWKYRPEIQDGKPIGIKNESVELKFTLE